MNQCHIGQTVLDYIGEETLLTLACKREAISEMGSYTGERKYTLEGSDYPGHVRQLYTSEDYTRQRTIHVRGLYTSEDYTRERTIHVRGLYMSEDYTRQRTIHMRGIYTSGDYTRQRTIHVMQRTIHVRVLYTYA